MKNFEFISLEAENMALEGLKKYLSLENMPVDISPQILAGLAKIDRRALNGQARLETYDLLTAQLTEHIGAVETPRVAALPKFMVGKFWFSSETGRDIAIDLMTGFLGSDNVVYPKAGCVFELKQPATKLLLELLLIAIECHEIPPRQIISATNLKTDLTAWLEVQP